MIISAPAKTPDATLAMASTTRPTPAKHHVSRTPPAHELSCPRGQGAPREFWIKHGLMTDDPLVHERPKIARLPHKDLRRARPLP